MADPDLDPARLERILAPLNADDGRSIAIEDPDGNRLAGRSPANRTSGQASSAARADVVVDGVLVARIVASTPRRADGLPRALVRSLGITVEELVVETRTRRAAERALAGERAAIAATALGTDAAELAKGRQQQRSLLSLVAPEIRGYDLASHYAAAREIGGDLFELFRLRHRRGPLAIVIGDVTGKGLDAALLMAFARPVLHSALNAARSPGDALQRTNRVLVQERRGTLFITAVSAVLQPTTGRVRIANAGHEPPLLVPADGSLVRPVGDAGVLLGAFAAVEPLETELTLAPGDRLLFYTDGATDAVGPAGDRFGDDRLLAAIESARAGSAHDLVTAVRDAIERFRGPVEPADDLTLVAVGRRGPRGGARSRSARTGGGR